MATSIGGGVPPPGQTPLAETPAADPASTNAVADAQQAAHQAVQQKQNLNLEQSDAFAAHQQSNNAVVSKEDLDKARVAFAQKFPPDIVKFVAQGLNATIDPYKAMQARALISNSPVGQQAIEDVKVALEESAQGLAQKPAGLDNPPLQTGSPQLLAAERLGPGQSGATETTGTPAAQALLRSAATLNDPLNEPLELKPVIDKTPLKPATAADKTAANKTATVDANKLAANNANAVKNAATAKTPADAKSAAANPPPQTPAAKPNALLPGEASGAQAAPKPGVALSNESSGAQTGGGEGGNQGNGGEAAANLGAPPTPPVHTLPPFGGGTQPLTAAGRKATISLNKMQDLLMESAGPEAALVVLMAAIEDVDNDLKAAQQMMQIRHEVNDAMRNYINQFNKETWQMGDNNFEWQRMTFTVGYDKNGNMFVQSFPDVTWQTGTPQHESGKGTSDITPEKGFATAVGPQGVQEAQGNGSYHMLDGNTCVGLTSYRSLNAAAIPAEDSFMNSQMSGMKEEDEKWTMNLQNMMDTRKNMLQQFGKIWQSRSDSWAQQIAQLVQ